MQGVTFGEYGDEEGLDGLPFSDSAAVIVEPVQGESGVKIPPRGFLKAVEKRCRESGCLLVVDEIQSGLCRTGKMWAHQHSGVKPDMLTVAKGLGGGIPFGVTMVAKRLAEHVEVGDHTTTFGGNPLACAAASAVIDYLLKNRVAERAAGLGEVFGKRMLEMKKSKIYRESRNLGLMAALELRTRFNGVLEEALRLGLITLYSGRNVVRMLPPLTVSEEELEEGLGLLSKAVSKAEKDVSSTS